VSNDVLVLAEHRDGALSDVTFELLGKARELAGGFGGRAVVLLLGAPQLVGELGGADLVRCAEHPVLDRYNPEAYERVVRAAIEELEPRLFLTSTTTVGLDLAGAISVASGTPLVSYVCRLEATGDHVVATAQIYGGKLLAEVELPGPRAICAVLAGSFPARAPAGEPAPAVEPLEVAHLLDGLRTAVTAVVVPEAGDVDITSADLLVSVGRGIGNQGNLEVVEELAEALGAPLAASRPLVDQGWLPKSRQVGKSGLKVSPRVYLMFGISGAPEHLEGIREAELVIACNTDAKAPIFEVADYGTTVDLFDLVPEILDRVKA
jgi:electron transfer flavoprotein alpha subunit